jgi:hypothetical protein
MKEHQHVHKENVQVKHTQHLYVIQFLTNAVQVLLMESDMKVFRQILSLCLVNLQPKEMNQKTRKYYKNENYNEDHLIELIFLKHNQ